MRIHTDHNGVYVNAISKTSDDKNVEGHMYQIQAGKQSTTLMFQLGGVATNGVNGLTNEALLAVLLHRINVLNRAFPCPENFKAISHLEDAMTNLEVRTARRMVRGVEGKEVM